MVISHKNTINSKNMWYEPIPDSDKYDCVQLANEENYPSFLEISTRHYRFKEDVEWKSFDINVISQGNSGDFHGFMGRDLVLTDRSWEIMKPLIKDDVELATLRSESKFFFLLVIKKIFDCLDYDKSSYHARTAEMIGVESYVFKEEMISGCNIFFLSRAHHIVVSQEFRDRVEKYQLKGLIFRPLT